MMLEAYEESGTAANPDLIEWVVQAVLHDPLRGLVVMAVDGPPELARPGDALAGSSPVAAVGMAALVAGADPLHGWGARLPVLFVRPPHRRRGVGRWLLEETLELARHHGMNHVVCDLIGGGEAARRTFAAAGLTPRQVDSYGIELHPLYAEE
jgi:GNAT superfamily N-acetyltransferase